MVMALGMICMAAAFALTASEMLGWRRGHWLFKPLASALFVLIAIALGAPMGGLYGLFVFIALALCAIGDVMLISRDNEKLFKAGIGVFLAGHVAYIGAFVQAGFQPSGIQLGLLITPVLVIPYLLYLWPKITPDFRVPIAAYTAIIALMIITAFGAGTTWLLPVAALMFAVSDMMVGRDRFVKSVPVNALVITPLYYGAQVMFALSVAG